MHLTFALSRPHGQWVVDEIRLADKQWESVDRLRQALNDVRWLQSQMSMLELAQGLLRYYQAKGSFPPTSGIVALTDLLQPQYMPRLVRTDAWGSEIDYQQLSAGQRYQITSAGPDRHMNTRDDIVLVDGRVQTPPPAGSSMTAAP